MIEPSLFLKALGVGVAVAAPVGPMSLLCMRRSLAQGWRSGLATGLGIAAGDATFAGVAALGLAGVSRFMLAHQAPLHLAAGLFLLWLGLASLRRRATEPAAATEEGRSGVSIFSGAWLLTLTNPPTIIMFAAVFAALAPRGGLDSAGAAQTVAGVFAGSLTWWCGVVAAVTAARRAVGPRASRWIDRASAALLAAFGVAELRRAL
jgi:threonine/homoserine/homoserine lactone efflux protein